MSEPQVHDGRYFLPPLEDPWMAGKPEGGEYETLRASAAQTFEERMQWVEAVSEMIRFNHPDLTPVEREILRRWHEPENCGGD